MQIFVARFSRFASQGEETRPRASSPIWLIFTRIPRSESVGNHVRSKDYGPFLPAVPYDFK